MSFHVERTNHTVKQVLRHSSHFTRKTYNDILVVPLGPACAP